MKVSVIFLPLTEVMNILRNGPIYFFKRKIRKKCTKACLNINGLIENIFNKNKCVFKKIKS